MNWDAMSTIAEVVSAIAVVVSLVYLAIQLRTNTKALKANGAWDSEIVYGNANYEIALDPDFALLYSRASSASADIADFTEAEQAQLYFAVRSALQFAQAQWWLWQSGSLPDELWEMRRLWAKNFIASPVMSTIWQAELKQHIFADKFAEDIQSGERHGQLSIAPRRS